MSQADKLLESLTSEPGNIASGNIVIGDDCFITVPESLKKIAVQYDHNVETVTFDCPRYRDGHDMFKMKIYVNYLRADGVLGTHLCSNVVLDDNDSNLMHFDWTVSGHATYAAGDLSFLVCIKDVDKDGNEKFHWNTELNTEMYVSPGMKCNEVILAKHPDIITRLLSRMDETESFVRDIQVAAVGRNDDTATVEKTETDGSMKLTFGIPKGSNGKSAYQTWLDLGNTGSEDDFIKDITGQDGASVYQVWLESDPNNAGKTEKEFLETLNGSVFDVWNSLGTGNGSKEEFLAFMRGADGIPATHSWDGTVLTVTSASGTSSADLKGEKGEPGVGQNGATFRPSVDSEGNLSWTNDGGMLNPEPVNIKGPRGDSTGGNGTPIVTAISTNGIAYTATVDGLESIEVGQELTIIPNRTSATTSPSLSVNGSDYKQIRCQLTTKTSDTTTASTPDFLSKDIPVRVRWDGMYWVSHMSRPDASSINGTLPINKGGTGATNSDDALIKLGAAPVNHSHDGHMSTSVYDPNGKSTDIFKYVDDAISSIPGGSSTADVESGDLPSVSIHGEEGNYTINFAKWSRVGNFYSIGALMTAKYGMSGIVIDMSVPQAAAAQTLPDVCYVTTTRGTNPASIANKKSDWTHNILSFACSPSTTTNVTNGETIAIQLNYFVPD